MRYTPEALDALRHEGDPFADAVIADLAASGRTAEVNRVLRAHPRRGLSTASSPR
ncbi:hypothetical protein ACGFNX_42620 [Streptomyces sp. NPDC048723]|uniref:hypothetical protein n=1 Tax=unclassified Streptomyces TaxID=2593676 RepID=UPI003562DF96